MQQVLAEIFTLQAKLAALRNELELEIGKIADENRRRREAGDR